MKEVLAKDYRPECLLKVAAHIPERARFPVVDAHNHLFGDVPAEQLIEMMDAVRRTGVGQRDGQHHAAVGRQHLYASSAAQFSTLWRITCGGIRAGLPP